MRISSFLAVALLEASAALAAPSLEATRIEARSSKHASKRPHHPIAPKHCGRPFPTSPDRKKTCYVSSHGQGKDDSDYILKAIKDCNDGGHVVFSQGTTYTIGTALDLTFLKHIDLGTFPTCTL